jgi:hypothetical protein
LEGVDSLERRQKRFIITIVSLLLIAGLCLAIFLPGCGNEGEGVDFSDAQESFVVEEVERGEPLSGPEEMMQVAKAEAERRIGKTLEISEYSSGAERQRFYQLATADGENAGWIEIDIYGSLLSLYDATLDPPYFTDVNLDEEEAKAAAGELLEELGFDADYMQVVSSKLNQTGATGLGEDLEYTWEYVVEFKPCLNGIFIDDGDYCEVRLSPTDGVVLGLNVVRSSLRLAEAPAEALISEEEALELALLKANAEGEGLEFTVIEDGFMDQEGVRLRYLMPGQSPNQGPMLCWRITLEFSDANEPLGIGGGQYEVIVNALTGEVFIIMEAMYG